jgi:bifunctional non-homologous end joining protein LigD
MQAGRMPIRQPWFAPSAYQGGSEDAAMGKRQPDRKVDGRQSSEKRAPLAVPRSPRAASTRNRVAQPQSEVEAQAVMPLEMKPQLAALVDRPPSGPGWVYEVKYDGYRVLCRLQGGKARLLTRNGHDWTARMPQLARELERLPAQQAWLDGEIVVATPDGRFSFQALQKALSTPGPSGILYYLFDLLFLDGRELRPLPLLERKAQLAGLLAGLRAPTPLRFSEHVEQDGTQFYEHACRHSVEGVVGKRRDSAYIGERGRGWIKIKCRHRQEFVIGGFTEPAGSRKGLGALLLGVYDARGQLRFAGKVGTGFAVDTLRSLRPHLEALEQPASPFVTPPGRALARSHWVQPALVAEVSFSDWTEDHLVRHASFEGLREDKLPEAVTREAPEGDAVRAERRTGMRSAAPPGVSPHVAGVEITHGSRMMYPGASLTKLELARYYEAIGEWILPHLKGRPLSLVRCPAGERGECFFQKHLRANAPPELGAIEVHEAQGSELYAVADTVPAIIRLVQLGALELHTWGARVPDIERPDRITIDLDPAVGVPWSRVIEAAHLVRALLLDLGLTSFAKTTGGQGLHLLVPLQRRHSWDEVRAFSSAIAEYMATLLPTQFTARAGQAQRERRVYIDCLRNARGATTVSAFSTRAQARAPVSVPLAWDEVSAELASDHFNVGNVRARLAGLRHDPWAGFWKLRQSITEEMKQRLGMTEKARQG